MRYSIVTFACLVALTGCGGDNGSPSSSGGTTPPPPTGAPASSAAGGAPVALTGTVNDHGTKSADDSGTVEMEMDDFYFGPTYVQAKPGSKLTIDLENEGKAPHTFTIDTIHVDVEVQPDSKGTATVTMPASGALAFYCKFHKAQGMQGAFFGTPGDKVLAAGSSSGDGGAYGQ